jgi:hypothetical protein
MGDNIIRFSLMFFVMVQKSSFGLFFAGRYASDGGLRLRTISLSDSIVFVTDGRSGDSQEVELAGHCLTIDGGDTGQ